MGTLYLDGQAQYVGSDKNVPRYKKNQKILIGDTDPDSASLWVRVPTIGILVADRVILVNVSAEELFAAGFDIGQRIRTCGGAHNELLIFYTYKPSLWARLLNRN